MERAIEFLLQNQATLEQRVEQTQAQLSQTQGQLGQVVESIAELNRVVQMQSTSQSELNQMLTRAVTGLAEAQAKTEAKVDRLAGLVERLAGGRDGTPE
jgi:septal ring factor EnvC (AmiA/AmiB activator)